MPNQRHRADVSKMMVHPEARRKGIGRRLMVELERIAREERRTLLTLDTRQEIGGEPLYRSLWLSGRRRHSALCPSAGQRPARWHGGHVQGNDRKLRY
jgi:GNAT superfamily N-acetyltransferase